MTISGKENTIVVAGYLTLEVGKYQGAVVIRTTSVESITEIQVKCTDNRDTAADALFDADQLAKAYQP